MTNCVFVGSVSARDIAGGILGINGNYTTTGIANAVAREAVLTDCANYGTVTAADCAAGVLGKAIGVATLTRCYNGGTVSTSATSSAALMNVQQSAAAAVVLNDCYYLPTSASVGMTKNDTATQVTVNYDATAATELQTATSAELTAKTAFNAWGILSSSSAAMPKVALCLVTGHDYDTQTVDPTCSEKGYTACTCKNCGYSYHADFVDTVAHTEGEDWVVDKEPTEDSAGSRHKECTVCGEVLKNEIIKKLGGSTTTAKKEDLTTAPGTEDTSDDEKKGGCGSSLAIGGAMGITLLISLGFVAAKKKEND